MAQPFGDKVQQKSSLSPYSLTAYRDGVPSVTGRMSVGIMAWREHKYNDPTLHWTCIMNDGSKDMSFSVKADGSMTDWGDDNYYWRMAKILFKINGSLVAEMNWNGRKQLSNFKNQQTYYMSPNGSESGSCRDHPLAEENLDTGVASGGGAAEVGKKGFTSSFYAGFQVEDAGLFKPGNWYKDGTVATNMEFWYPLYIPVPSKNNGLFPSGPSNGSKDVSDGETQLTNWWTYSITKSGYTNYLNWSPSTSKGEHNLGITTKAVIQGTEYDATGSNQKSYTHNTVRSSYSGYVKRYYTDASEISTTSSSVTAYTYSQPSLDSITLSKTTISPRSGASLRVTLNGMNNRNWSVENHFDTRIWSNCRGSKSSPYSSDRTTTSYKDYSSADVKALFPDTSASNGVVSGTIYTLRRNVGVSGGNPRKWYTNLRNNNTK